MIPGSKVFNWSRAATREHSNLLNKIYFSKMRWKSAKYRDFAITIQKFHFRVAESSIAWLPLTVVVWKKNCKKINKNEIN